jgi:hypothetical protein
MALAVSILARDVSSLKRIIALLTLSGTYTTGGEAPTEGFKKALGMTRFHAVFFEQSDVLTTGGLVASYDHAADKVFLRETAGTVDLPLKELSSGASLTGVLLRAEFIGEGNN